MLMTTDPKQVAFRSEVVPSDAAAIRKVVAATGFFSHAETEIAVELVDECLAKGVASGYEFIIAESRGSGSESNVALVGYACYGEIPCTVGSYDVYWIVVDPGHQGGGLGQALMRMVHDDVARRGGRGIYIDTSGREQYAATRHFYQRCGYVVVADLPGFYGPDDAKKIYWRHVSPDAPPGAALT